MIRRLIALAARIGGAILLVALGSDSAFAERRVALVVGNSTYQSVPQLPNPSRDASSVARMFRDAGFDTVETLVNVGNLEFKRAIRKFETTADQADIAVVYYAGHGLEIGGTNYLIPVDARLASDRDADDEAIPLERLVSSADGAKRLRLVILDACRDNPFVTTMRRERRNSATRAVSGGLGKVEPTSTDTLIAYAAKAGSTADDGDGEHSPFTTSVLKNLPVPGLDVRLAFGRVRDEVLKATGNRQEPFVYGALGGGTISLVPAPAVPQEQPVSDVKADYDLVQKIGTKRAWEVFLATHPTGFYAELARAQMEALGNQPQAAPPNVQVAAYPQAPAPPRDAPPTKEQIEWDRIKDSVDIPALQRFVKRFPDSPLAIAAQQRVDMLKQANQEREDRARAEREAARLAAEEAKRKADQEKAELAAQRKREDDERRAREAEAAEKARAAAAAVAAEKKRQEDERRAREAEAERQAKAAEAERKALEAKQRAEQAERDRIAAEAATAKAAAEKQAKDAEEARKRAEIAAAKQASAAEKKRLEDERRAAAAEAERLAKAAEVERKAQEAKQRAEQAERDRIAAEAAAAKAAAEKQAREADEARKAAELAAAREAACKSEQSRLDAIIAKDSDKGSDGSGIDDLKAFSKTVTCDRLGPVVVAAIDRFNVEAAKRAATQPNSPQLVTSAQTELVRIGCLTGKPDGRLSDPTRAALVRYLAIGGQPTQPDKISVTTDLVAELTKHATRVCPLQCKSDETLKGDVCVANEKPAPATASRKSDDEDKPRRKPAATAEREPARRAKPETEAPRARQQAVARPSIVSGGGGGHSTMIGVGF
ncbi:caspase family protein [Bradyrhizobium manausense]|uniref:caspase family protein n=1 Tax=Bradyrhizobium TaxID=374 RepID=UPI001BAA7F64|nr:MULTISPECIES: caspase family protein [Bradyrhizobium]MBR0826993.1 caspase family protein [Bradyrhizobium manausense]UVO32276.1 caspase family protein [Bradyrhizobium arachidis]